MLMGDDLSHLCDFARFAAMLCLGFGIGVEMGRISNADKQAAERLKSLREKSDKATEDIAKALEQPYLGCALAM
jgi:hypothetical protein